MRFAGSAIEDFMGSSPNYGELGTANAANKGREQIASIYGDAKVAGMGMSQAAETEAHGLITEAQGKLGAAQQQASNMGQIGGLLGQGIGGLGGLFKGGGVSGGGGYGKISDPTDSFKAAGITGPIYDFTT